MNNKKTLAEKKKSLKQSLQPKVTEIGDFLTITGSGGRRSIDIGKQQHRHGPNL